MSSPALIRPFFSTAIPAFIHRRRRLTRPSPIGYSEVQPSWAMYAPCLLIGRLSYTARGITMLWTSSPVVVPRSSRAAANVSAFLTIRRACRRRRGSIRGQVLAQIIRRGRDHTFVGKYARSLQAPAGNPAMGFHLEEICMSSYVGSDHPLLVRCPQRRCDRKQCAC